MDAEGTLGGLVSQAEPDRPVHLTRRALRDSTRCSSNPLCAERLPQPHADFLHGAACHVCLFVSETTCERGNKGAAALRDLADRVAAGWPEQAILGAGGQRFGDVVPSVLRAHTASGVPRLEAAAYLRGLPRRSSSK